MPPKRKNNIEEGAPSQPRSRRSRVPKNEDTSAVKAEAKSDRVPKIQWEPNEWWTDRLVEYLSNNPDVRLKMFSDSVKDARKESRKKVVGSKPKVEYYRQIAQVVFDVVDEAERPAYVSDPEHYATSVMGRITYLQKTYTVHRKSLKVTGGGLKDDDDDGSEAYNNQLEKIRSSFRWWDVLHAWWSEHPKYAFQMMTNSTSGINKMVCDLEQAISTPTLDKHVADEDEDDRNDSKVASLVDANMSSSHPSSVSTPLLSPLAHPTLLPDIDSLSWNNLKIDPALLEADPPLLQMDSPHHQVDLDVKTGLNSEDSVSIPSSSRTLARTTPASKSKGPAARQSLRTPGSKGRKDFITDFHEATRIDQEQAKLQAEHHHAQQMVRLEIKKEKMQRKYEIESLKLQVQLAQIQQQPQQQQPQQQHPA